jgi:hypothetical protein
MRAKTLSRESVLPALLAFAVFFAAGCDGGVGEEGSRLGERLHPRRAIPAMAGGASGGGGTRAEKAGRGRFPRAIPSVRGW